MKRIFAVLREHPWLVGGFLTALGITLFFATRMVVFIIYWSDPAHRDQTIQDWMTPGYVSKSWDVPRDDLKAVFEALDLTSERKTLAQIAAEGGIPVQELTMQIEAAIAASRASDD
jgi:hypothetical protein